MNDIQLILWSTAYVLLVLAFASLVAKAKKDTSELTRKLVHILAGNWVFFTPHFTQLWAVVFVPFVFVIVNGLSIKYNLIPAMERREEVSYGTVYYAVSLLVLSGLGFIFKWRVLPLIGILIMTYGDGLAAITGQGFGRTKPFSFAPRKTLVGTMTVASCAFVITLAVLLTDQSPAIIGVPEVFLIALMTAVFSAFVELIGSKGSDNLLLPLASGLFASLAYYYATVGYYLYLLSATAILIFAYHKKAITPDGIVAAILTAASLYTLGGFWVALSLVVFFILGSVLSKLKNDHKAKAEALQEPGSARNWKQVLCNSLPASLIVWLAMILDRPDLNLVAIAVFSAASADTFSSEIGMMSKGKVYNILTGQSLPSGVSGGVSKAGFLAGLLGALLLGLLALADFGMKGLALTTGLGFLGTLVDSLLGAAFQAKYTSDQAGLQDRASGGGRLIGGYAWMTNNMVNLTTLCVVAITGLIILF